MEFNSLLTFRKALGMNQQDMAHLFNTKRELISMLESEKRTHSGISRKFKVITDALNEIEPDPHVFETPEIWNEDELREIRRIIQKNEILLVDLRLQLAELKKIAEQAKEMQYRLTIFRSNAAQVAQSLGMDESIMTMWVDLAINLQSGLKRKSAPAAQGGLMLRIAALEGEKAAAEVILASQPNVG